MKQQCVDDVNSSTCENFVVLLLFPLAQLYIHIELFQSNLVVSQFYDTDVNKAYVIRGNAAILKCEIPSFVADFVSVVSWHTDQDETFYPNEQYGWLDSIRQCSNLFYFLLKFLKIICFLSEDGSDIHWVHEQLYFPSVASCVEI